MDGVVNVLKPAGMTSHDVVAKLRKIYKTKRVGHTGTLDPDAVGVLPICIGQATRLVEYLMEKEKTYRTIVTFGSETNTQDQSGEVTKKTDLPTLSKEEFLTVIKGFIGEIQQIPPMYSAIKKDGQPLYKLARQGIEVDIEPRTVVIHDIQVKMYQTESAMLEVRCSKGTYIRTLCQDIGKACNSSAHMGYLLRSKSGNFTIEDAVSIETLQAAQEPEKFLVSLHDATKQMNSLTIYDQKVKNHLTNGLAQRLKQCATIKEGTVVKAIDEQNNVLAIGCVDQGYFKPTKVFKSGGDNEA